MYPCTVSTMLHCGPSVCRKITPLSSLYQALTDKVIHHKPSTSRSDQFFRITLHHSSNCPFCHAATLHARAVIIQFVSSHKNGGARTSEDGQPDVTLCQITAAFSLSVNLGFVPFLQTSDEDIRRLRGAAILVIVSANMAVLLPPAHFVSFFPTPSRGELWLCKAISYSLRDPAGKMFAVSAFMRLKQSTLSRASDEVRRRFDNPLQGRKVVSNVFG